MGVDLDGTLAFYGDWQGPEHIGEPLQPMVDRIKDWLAQGIEVRIVTARMAGQRVGIDPEQTKALVQDWLESACGLPRLEVTCKKDFGMLQLWDDRAIQVIPNTGMPVVGSEFNRDHAD